MTTYPSALGLSLLLMLAVGMWCGADRARRSTRRGVVAAIALGWLALIGAATSAGTASTAWVWAAALSSITAAHLVAYVLGDQMRVKDARGTLTRRGRG